MNSINHIHIPRCSGIYVKEHILPDLKSRNIPYFATNHGIISKDSFENKRFISGHFGMTPLKYRSDLINVCLLRNPVDRFVSNFLYVNQGLKGLQIESGLEKWIYESQQHNLQAKSLSSIIDEEKYNASNHGADRANNGWYLEQKDIDISKIKNFIDSIEIIDTMENHSRFINNFNELLNKVFGFSTFSNKNLINSNNLKIKISDNLKNKIIEVNSIDMEIYEYVKGKK